MSAYNYDANGNIGSITDGTETIFYRYDELNRIIAECNGFTNQTIKYKYDAWGNIAMKWIFSGTSTWNPDSSKLIKKIDYVYSSSTEGMAWKDLMTKYDGKTITYDAIGNPTSYMGSTMYWEGRNLVEQIKNGTTITYSYDSSDMRTSKTVGGVKHNYYYVEGKLMYEDCPSYKLFYAYDANGFLSGIKRVKSNGTTENYGVHCNIFGDVIAIYEQGVLIAKYTYDSWGKLISVTESNGLDIMGDNDIWTQNSIRYRGYVYDNETGWYYLQSRYYDPEICRFINADDYSVLTASPTALTDKNLFAYCDCNPVNRLDNDGELWHFAVGAIVGATIGCTTEIISQCISSKKETGKISLDLGHILISTGSGAISGLLSASGAGLIAMTVGSAAISAGTNVAEQCYSLSKGESDCWDWRGFWIDTSVGAVFGLLGGKGSSYGNTQSIKYSNKQLSIRLFEKKDNFASVIKYYTKTAKNGAGTFVIKDIIKPDIVDGFELLFNIVSAFF